MFSLKRTYKWSRKRIDELQKTSPPDEAFVLTMFFVEKNIRRTLLQLMIRSGLSLTDAITKMKDEKWGIWALKSKWKNYDPQKRDLEMVIGLNAWAIIKSSAELRNDLAHGSDNQGQRFYSKQLPPLIQTLDDIRKIFSSEYQYEGWKGMRDQTGKII